MATGYSLLETFFDAIGNQERSPTGAQVLEHGGRSRQQVRLADDVSNGVVDYHTIKRPPKLDVSHITTHVCAILVEGYPHERGRQQASRLCRTAHAPLARTGPRMLSRGHPSPK